LSFIFALSLFSIAGVPPLLGFYGKLYIFEALVKKVSTLSNNLTLTEHYNNINSLLVHNNVFSYSNMALTFTNYKYYIVIIIALLMSVISALYYLRLIRIMFFNTETPWLFLVQVDKVKALIISYTTLINLFFFIYPKPLYVFVNKITSEWYF
jgi:NADH-quinone oxidoreductase subunit N